MAIGDALLALLLPGPRHGYDLKRGYDTWFAGLRPLAFGQVYSTLARLQRDELVQVAQTESGEGPERTVYELTVDGRTRAQAWLSEPLDPNVPGGAPADELIRKTLAAYRLTADPAEVMARQRTAHLRAIRALESTDGAPANLSRTVFRDHQRLHLDADLRWLELAGEHFRRRPIPDPAELPELSEPEDATPAEPVEGARP